MQPQVSGSKVLCPPCIFAQWSLGGSMLRQTHCFQVVKKKHRTRMLEFFIDVARECFNIGNFNSMMAIICEYPGTEGLACATCFSVP